MREWGGRAQRRLEEERQAQWAAIRDTLAAPDKPRREPWWPVALAAVRSWRYRYRRILAPFAVLASLIVAGGVVAARDTSTPAVALLCVAAGVGWWRWRSPRLRRPQERRYAALCLASAAGWLVWCATAEPAWLPLVAGWAGMSAPWWRHHWPRVRVAVPDVEPIGDPVIADWDAHVGDQPYGPLPGAHLSDPTPFAAGTEYRVRLVKGKQTMDDALRALGRVASGISTPMARLVFEAHPDYLDVDPNVGRLRVMTASPVKDTVMFDRPRWRDGRIQLGPFTDGMGEAEWRLYTENSMWGGFLLGGTGSGKSRQLDGLALTVRAMSAQGWPTMIVYVDGQDGASSPTLWQHATLRADSRGCPAVLDALSETVRIRQQFNIAHRLDGFTPGLSPDGAAEGLTGILVIVDEAHVPFELDTPRWARLAREGRKVGVVLLAASQYNDLAVFGGSEPLRASLAAGNVLAMRTVSTMAKSLIPGLRIDPASLPAIPGYGYKIAATDAERTAPFRARYLPSDRDIAADRDITVPSVQQWFQRTSDAPLDAMSARAMGELYLRRADLAAEQEAAALAEIEGRAPERERIDLDKPKATTADVVLAVLSDGPRSRADLDVEVHRRAGAGRDLSTVGESVKKALGKLQGEGRVVRSGGVRDGKWGLAESLR